jgi:two-component system OmpR family response regulator
MQTHRSPHILVVDDDEGITSLLSDYLSRFGFVTHVAADGRAMQQQLDNHPISLVVLDIMLPGSDGLALAHALRAKSRIPIIMLSARGGLADRVVGLEMGADDYMSKPFEPRELVARVQSVLRRASSAKQIHDSPTGVICFDGWELRREERQLISPSGLAVPLSNAEFLLLSAFLQAPRRVVSRDQLMSQARGRAMDGTERSIDLLVSRLRQKLSDESSSTGQGLIRTVRGAGYMFDPQSINGLTAWRH